MKSFDQWFEEQGQAQLEDLKAPKVGKLAWPVVVTPREGLKWEEYDADKDGPMEEPEEMKCCGCEKLGVPNYHSQGRDEPADEYWCGGSPRCCP